MEGAGGEVTESQKAVTFIPDRAAPINPLVRLAGGEVRQYIRPD